MGSAEDAEPNHVDILLKSSLGDHLWGLSDARIDDLEAGVAQHAGHDFGPPIVAVQPRFGHQHTDFAFTHRPISFPVLPSDSPLSPL
jgi:hypothetical protein